MAILYSVPIILFVLNQYSSFDDDYSTACNFAHNNISSVLLWLAHLIEEIRYTPMHIAHIYTLILMLTHTRT